jgi:hypothetical protein
MDISTSSIQAPQVLFTPEGLESFVRPASGIYCRTLPGPCNDGSRSSDKSDTLPPTGPGTEPPQAPMAANFDGAAAEAGLSLLDQIESLRDLLVCLSAQVRRPGTPEMPAATHLVCDATEVLRAVEVDARRVLCGLVGLPGGSSTTAVVQALGAAAEGLVDALLWPAPAS